jgi:hypothetical protein
MIISASRRTDLPAFYAEWLVQRFRAGFCLVPNPYYPEQVSRISLAAEDVDVIVFWTRNPRPLLPYLAELTQRQYRYYFQYTLLANPPSLDPGALPEETSLATFRALAETIGPERVIWRYDPMVLSPETDYDFHRRNFERLATALRGYTRHCVISLLDPYRKTEKRMKGIELLPQAGPDFAALLHFMAETAHGNGLDIQSCAEPASLEAYGIRPGKCVDDAYIREVFGIEVTHAKDPVQRPACGCVTSRDIGAYDTCLAGCRYCYATSRFERSKANYQRHDPQSPLQIGWPKPSQSG